MIFRITGILIKHAPERRYLLSVTNTTAGRRTKISTVSRVGDGGDGDGGQVQPQTEDLRENKVVMVMEGKV